MTPAARFSTGIRGSLPPAADWHAVANDYRRHSLGRMLGAVDPGFTIDWVHRVDLDEILPAHGLTAVSGNERDAIVRQWHALKAWPDFVPALESLRRRFVCVSFTLLSLSLVIDVSRRNGIVWHAVIACEMLRVYKTQPEAYRRAAAHLALRPDEILMVACHNFDLDSARPNAIAQPSYGGPRSGARLAHPIRRRTRPATSSSMVSPNWPAHWFDNRTELARGLPGSHRAQHLRARSQVR